jgi:dTDP-4-amino-4,6-dideoxygalactose transaminase
MMRAGRARAGETDRGLVGAVPFSDLSAQHREIAAEVEAGWAEVVRRSAFVLGEEVEAFEHAFAEYLRVGHCVGVGNGTDALELALRVTGLRPGDEVVVPANSFVASAFAVLRSGARLVLADVDPETLLLDAERAAERIGPRTSAVMLVHLYGQMVPVEAFGDLVADRRVHLVEDVAHAHGATRHGRRAGALGSTAGVSFYPSKNMGAYGDAGAMLTGSDEMARLARALRNQGAEAPASHTLLGFNSRLDSLQAIVLRAKLARLDAWNRARQEAAQRYAELLGELERVRLPRVLEGNEHVWHLYVVRVSNRDRVLDRLRDAGIAAGVHYPTPINLQPAFRGLGHRPGEFPAAEAAAREVLSLPMFPHITPAQQERVADELRRALR